MDSLTLNINRDELTALMRDFYLLTGIKIALFEPDGKEILSYPEITAHSVPGFDLQRKDLSNVLKATGIHLTDVRKRHP